MFIGMIPRATDKKYIKTAGKMNGQITISVQAPTGFKGKKLLGGVQEVLASNLQDTTTTKIVRL